jgi:hypothetical protein
MEVLRGMLESKGAFRELHTALLRAHADGIGGGGGLTNLELMQLGLQSSIAREPVTPAARHSARRSPPARRADAEPTAPTLEEPAVRRLAEAPPSPPPWPLLSRLLSWAPRSGQTHPGRIEAPRKGVPRME